MIVLFYTSLYLTPMVLLVVRQPQVPNGEQEVQVDIEIEADMAEVQIDEDNIEIVAVEMDEDDEGEVLFPAPQEEMVPDNYEIIDVWPADALAELEFRDIFDVLNPDVDEEVSIHIIMCYNKKTGNSISFTFQFEPIVSGDPVFEPRVRVPMIERPAGVQHELPLQHNIGALNEVCSHCNARHFASERASRGHFTTCCNNGQVAVTGHRVLFPVPERLMSLLVDDSQEGRHFHFYIIRFITTYITTTLQLT